jgi:hypothetical protein
MFKVAPHSLFACLLATISLFIAGLACNIPFSDSYMEDWRERRESERLMSPAGVWKGVITETEMADRGLMEWLEDGTVVSNEVNIIISADGVVTGSFVFEKVDNVSLKEETHIPPCISSNDQLFVGEASGELIENTGRIVFDVEQTIVRKYTKGCSIGPSEQTVVYKHRQHFEVEIVNENVTGIWMYGKSVSHLEDGHPIKAQFALRKE